MSEIQLRLKLLSLVPTGLVGVALAGYFCYAQWIELDTVFAAQGRLLLQSLALASSPAILANDNQALHRFCQQVGFEPDVVEANIVDRQGAVLARQFDNALAQRLPTDCCQEFTGPILAQSRPEPIGRVRLVMSKHSLERQRREVAAGGLALLLAGLALAAILARRAGRRIGEPLTALTLAVHELSKGNMEVRVEIESDAELAYLQAGFNAMAAELKQNRGLLETQVRQATARLHIALDDLAKRNVELESANGLAQAQTDLKSRFLAQMSHEIRTPMNGIIGFAELLAHTPLSPDQAEKLGIMTRSARQLLKISNEILDLSRLEAGKVSLDRRMFALRPVLEDVVCLLGGRQRRVTVILWVADDVPASIETDPTRLQQVIANFLANALKFTRRGRVVIRVRVLVLGGVAKLWFSVSDSGMGIAPQDTAKLFAPFQQLSASISSTATGAGLGLSIAKNIVENLGGSVHLASRLGRGTSLWFALPFTRPPQTPSEGAKPANPAHRVAVVEPQALAREALSLQLQSLGIAVEALDNFTQLASLASAQTVDCLLMALHTQPQAGGLTLPEKLQWCAGNHIRPVLLCPPASRHLARFYRRRGYDCLSLPLNGESVRQLLAKPGQASAAVHLHSGNPAPRLAVAAQNPIKLLVADDNEVNRLLLRAQLQGLAVSIDEAENGREALVKLRQTGYDLAFLDVQMPEMGGQEVLQKMRERPGLNSGIPFVAITAFSTPKRVEELLTIGFADCLLKPVATDSLTAWVAKALAYQQTARFRANPALGYASAILDKTNGHQGLALQVAESLFAGLAGWLAEARAALQDRDRCRAIQSVHKINGAASFAGLHAVSEAAAQLESALSHNIAVSLAENLCEDLNYEIDQFLATQQGIRSELTG